MWALSHLWRSGSAGDARQLGALASVHCRDTSLLHNLAAGISHDCQRG